MFNAYAQPEDFLTDDSFLAWYYQTAPEHVATWNQWIGNDTQRRELVDRAIDLLKVLHLEEKPVTETQVENAETNLSQNIHSIRGSSGSSTTFRRLIWMAAACLLLAGSFFIFRSFFVSRPAIMTNYGEIKEQKLPDGTYVKLNANSKVSYATGWKDGEDREVWINGEAFFHVKKTELKSRFIVHTDHFDVIVTGTQFNVVNRHGQSNVMLNEGSVTIKSSNGKEIAMSPGEFVEFRLNETQKRAVRNDSLLAWKDKRIVFDNTPVREVVNIIKDHYGVDVKLEDSQVGTKTISGMLPNDNLEVLLQAMDATNDLEVVHHNNEISIRNRQ